MKNFIKELSNFLENNLNNEKKGIPIIEEIFSENNFTTGNKNTVRWNLSTAISKYTQKSLSNDELYFIKDLKNDDVYVVLQAKDSKINEIEINKKDIPAEAKINDVLKFKNNNYVIDKIATKELKEDIKNMANEVLEKQNINLNKHRKEGHLYMVTEELGNNRFLLDLTDESEIEFEEVDIDKDILDRATEGIVLKYANGKYEYYSDDGFERIEKL